MTLALRFDQVRGLVAPAWVDSLHHVHIVQVLQEIGQIPRALPAYGDAPFYYHFGFHVSAALFGALAGVDAPQAVLVCGQILNTLIVPSVYALAARFSHRRSVGLLASLFTGLVAHMPGFYAAWGRATYTAGMLLLPVTMALALDTVRRREGRRTLCFAVMLSGLMLTHYVIAVYLACFLIIIVGASIGRPRSRNRIADIVSAPAPLSPLFTGIAIGCIAVLPWLLRIFPHIHPTLDVRIPTASLAAQLSATEGRLAYLWTLVRQPTSLMIGALALPASVAVLYRRRRLSVLVIWVMMLLLLGHQTYWKIGPFRTDLVAIALFLPGTILAAEGLLMMKRWFQRRFPRERNTVFGLFIIVILAVVAAGATANQTMVTATTVLIDTSDLDALNWIERHTPPEARFLINVSPWQGNLYRGMDGGWWIPLLTGRHTVLPPGIFYGWADQAYVTGIQHVSERVLALDGCVAPFWELARDEAITHIYVGTNGGPLSRVYWPACRGIGTAYERGGVSIYSVGQP